MATTTDTNDLRRANFRLCRLCLWPNYSGLGFNLENTTPPPHIIRTVESNSPAAAAGLKILDVILAVNNRDVSASDYRTTTDAIKNVRDNHNRIELLVIERRFYVPFKARGWTFDPAFARIQDTPKAMPREYTDFPKYTPRTCEIRLGKGEQSFGFEVVNGARDIGVFIQEVVPNLPASRTSLRKCDRVLEIDGKFVDNESSRVIFERLTKSKKKRAVKLYVVDTNTYKYFQDSRIPLPSKQFRSSTFARQYQPQPTSMYINVKDVPNEPVTTMPDEPQSPYRKPGTDTTQPSFNTNSSGSEDTHLDDIRLCSIARASAIDTYGIELNYHKTGQYHSLKLVPGRLDGPSNAALAGVKTDDRLIEIDGENIENIGDAPVKQRIRAIRYPEPLRILVTDGATYNQYKRQNRVINSRLPTVRRPPENTIDRSVSFAASRREPSTATTTSIIPSPTDRPSASGGSMKRVPAEVDLRKSLESSGTHRQQYQLYRIPSFPTYGFSVNSNQGVSTIHRITQILPNSPAAQQGLRVGDNILTVNNQDVTRMNAADFTQFLRASAQNADARSQPLVLEVIHDDAYQPPLVLDGASLRPSSTEQPQTSLPADGLPERVPSRDGSRTSGSTQPLTTGQLTSSRDDQRAPIATRPIVSRNGSQKAVQPIPYENTRTQPIATRPYTNGYSQQDIRPAAAVSSSSLNRSLENLTRGAVDVVSKSRLLRYCRLIAGPSQAFGFQLKADGHTHTIFSIQPDSPAARAGLEENDRLIEVDDENVEGKSSRDVAILIRNAAATGKLRVLIAPSGVKVLSRRSRRSAMSLNDPDYYRNSSVRSKHDDRASLSSDRYRSISRVRGERNYRDRPPEPSDPLPRKCVLQRDSSFRGCGFRLIEKAEYDTPIIVEVAPNSPAKCSGLSEGDHIIYVDSQNVQKFGSFDEIINLIQRSFEEYGQVTLITLTGPAYQVLRRRGGYLDSIAFDYQTANVDQLKPRLCRLKLSSHEFDFGFTLEQDDQLSVKNVEPNSCAETHGLRRGDIVLEANGQITKHLPIQHIKQMIETSKQERKLNLLVIDPDGYRFSHRHAIPLNSMLSFVQTGEQRATTNNHHHSHQPVYL